MIQERVSRPTKEYNCLSVRPYRFSARSTRVTGGATELKIKRSGKGRGIRSGNRKRRPRVRIGRVRIIGGIGEAADPGCSRPTARQPQTRAVSGLSNCFSCSSIYTGDVRTLAGILMSATYWHCRSYMSAIFLVLTLVVPQTNL
jgi:hypothetical protein